MNSKTAKKRKIILAISALLIVAVVAAYAAFPKGVTAFALTSDDGAALGESLSLYAGTDEKIGYSIEPSAFADRQVIYKVADESVLTVSDDGEIKALSPGETLITAEVMGVKQDLNVKVDEGVKSIEGLEKELSITEGYTHQLEPEVKMAAKGLKVPALTYKSDEESIATVDETGLITAVEPGTTTIIVTAGSVSKKIELTVNKRVVVSTPAPARTTTKSSGTTKKSTNNDGGSSDNSGWE